MIMGFAEAYRRIKLIQRQELVLLRAVSDTDALFYINANDNKTPNYNLKSQKIY